MATGLLRIAVLSLPLAAISLGCGSGGSNSAKTAKTAAQPLSSGTKYVHDTGKSKVKPAGTPPSAQSQGKTMTRSSPNLPGQADALLGAKSAHYNGKSLAQQARQTKPDASLSRKPFPKWWSAPDNAAGS